MRARAKDPLMLPPTAKFEANSTQENLERSFFFWWYPGNIYASLMQPKFPELTLRLQRGEEIDYLTSPTPEERATEETPVIDETEHAQTSAPMLEILLSRGLIEHNPAEVAATKNLDPYLPAFATGYDPAAPAAAAASAPVPPSPTDSEGPTPQ
ncbi:MAG: hypothetical protein HC883_02405 [Bdellovibrionaceae bacterium]|nr:hypothetical protein [Pseudobdellovibrionaceae bacterium]